jgi:hypothetical protein
VSTIVSRCSNNIAACVDECHRELDWRVYVPFLIEPRECAGCHLNMDLW